MPSFGSRSRLMLDQCDSRLVELATAAIKHVDFSVIEGHRDKERQNMLLNSTPPLTKVSWPNSKHNSLPSLAFDFAPYPIDWAYTERFAWVAGILMGIAKERGIPLRWGGDWDRDGELSDNRFNDLGHVEIYE